MAVFDQLSRAGQGEVRQPRVRRGGKGLVGLPHPAVPLSAPKTSPQFPLSSYNALYIPERVNDEISTTVLMYMCLYLVHLSFCATEGCMGNGL